MQTHRNPHSRHDRSGKIRRRLLIGLTLLLICAGVGGGIVYSYRDDGVVDAITRKPLVGEFVNEIVERGDVESSSNTEVRCEIASAEGVRILDIVAEGTYVKEGDIVVQLDDSTIKKDLSAQKIAVNTTEAAYAKAKNDLDAATIARQEYELGTFVQEEQKLQSELFVAEENSRRAENFFAHSQKLASRGYITDTQLESDKFAVQKFGKDLEAAQTKLKVIRDYTKPKTMKKHDSDIKTAEAAVASEKSKHEIELEKLASLEAQLAKCVIKAPSAGQVVYNNPNRWRDDDFVIRKGNRVRERQVIIKLPEAGKMQVKAKIGEARVNRVKPGMAATVRIEALRGVELKGSVQTVNAYASDENWFNPNTKEYDAIIVLDSPPSTLKPGMSSQVSIRVETLQNVLQVPIQTVVERGGKHYSIVRLSTGKLELRELLIGSINDKFIVVKDGLTANDDVLMNPRAHLTRVGLPEADPATESPKSTDESKPASPASPTRETAA
ncbi:MAG: HlyD family efflux transporter periplasmic adaptor subunit [Planctomycetes bacterium]|nr:HlyD family efflux transporter periplasmic adaptor subunit [Planctomycetota bacterium]